MIITTRQVLNRAYEEQSNVGAYLSTQIRIFKFERITEHFSLNKHQHPCLLKPGVQSRDGLLAYGRLKRPRQYNYTTSILLT